MKLATLGQNRRFLRSCHVCRITAHLLCHLLAFQLQLYDGSINLIRNTYNHFRASIRGWANDSWTFHFLPERQKSAKKSKSKDVADFTAACLAILQLELGRMAGRSTWHIGGIMARNVRTLAEKLLRSLCNRRRPPSVFASKSTKLKVIQFSQLSTNRRDFSFIGLEFHSATKQLLNNTIFHYVID